MDAKGQLELMNSKVALSLVIPARNEEQSLKIIVPAAYLFCRQVTNVVVVVDSLDDTSLRLKDLFLDSKIEVKFVVNSDPGIAGALRAGVAATSTDYVVICMADEVLPLMSLDLICSEFENSIEFVSVTRYKNGGRRFGGSPLGHLASRSANLLLRKLTKSEFSDLTTGMKAFNKRVWPLIEKDIDGAGWSPALAMNLNAIGCNLSMSEVPVTSVDRLFGGTSTFSFSSWVKGYIKTYLVFRKRFYS
jgi:dolichol-phosphate mannosyltransferase